VSVFAVYTVAGWVIVNACLGRLGRVGIEISHQNYACVQYDLVGWPVVSMNAWGVQDAWE
jgi:hypothetical protein